MELHHTPVVQPDAGAAQARRVRAGGMLVQANAAQGREIVALLDAGTARLVVSTMQMLAEAA